MDKKKIWPILGWPFMVLLLGATTSLAAGGPFNDAVEIEIPNASYRIYADDLLPEKGVEFITSYCDDASGSTGVAIYSGLIGNSFKNVQRYSTSCPADLVMGDFNHDGIRDIFGVSFDGQGPLGLFLLLGNKNGTFRRGEVPATGLYWQGTLVAADFNGDGVVDVAATYYLDEQDMSQRKIKFISGKDLSLQKNELDPSIGIIQAGQFSADRFADLLVANNGAFKWLKGDGNFSFKLAAQAPLPADYTFGKSFLAAMNGGRKKDVIIANHHLTNGDGATIIRPSCLKSMRHLKLPGPLLEVGDFDGDGYPDYLTYSASAGSNFVLVSGRGDGHVEGGTPVRSIPLPRSTVSGDFDGDGNLDLITLGSPFEKALLWRGKGK